ncbi:hypothetical protein DPMN_158910 [Dreissena polymorpha]|uniref:Uncharacterized protein n=1 Tax=Dreissena polymorpha TaxID=45954 RepID=A0A9D4INN4_DREPO|nr:hypothetical protein DPMN_158910 [Dreissena polymorpha]
MTPYGSTHTIPDSAIVPKHQKSTRQINTSQNCRVGLPEPQGYPWTFQDQQGSPRRLYSLLTSEYDPHLLGIFRRWG